VLFTDFSNKKGLLPLVNSNDVLAYFFVIAKIFLKSRDVFQKSGLSTADLTGTLGFLTRSYGKRTYWWEIIHILKRIAIIICGIMLLRSKGSEIYVVMFFILLGFLLLEILAFPYERRSMMRLSLLWNSIALLVLMTDVADDVKFTVGIFYIVFIVFGILMSFRQAYRSRITKIRKRFFDGEITSYDDSSSVMNLQIKPDFDVSSACKAQNLINPKIKVSIEWKSDLEVNIASTPTVTKKNKKRDVINASSELIEKDISAVVTSGLTSTNNEAAAFPTTELTERKSRISLI
jgi:hypothetical protein